MAHPGFRDAAEPADGTQQLIGTNYKYKRATMWPFFYSVCDRAAPIFFPDFINEFAEPISYCGVNVLLMYAWKCLDISGIFNRKIKQS